MSLRAVIVPLVDMRVRFNLGSPTYAQFTAVINRTVARRTIGRVVDAVSDAIALMPKQIMPPPKMGLHAIHALNTNNLIGLGTVDGRMIMLVAIAYLMLFTERGLIGKFAA
jgi:purine-binding chemotaxis protein CheW